MAQFQHTQDKLIQALQVFSLVHGDYPDSNLTIKISPLPLLNLLKGQKKSHTNSLNLFPKIYWQNKEQDNTLVSFGAIDKLHETPTPSNEDQFYIGGLAFQQQGKQWPGFPEKLFIRPLLIFQKEKQRYKVIFHFDGKTSVKKSMEAVKSLQPPQEFAPLNLQVVERQDKPNQKKWASLVNLAIEYKALLPKVVLSRQTKLLFDKPIQTCDLMALWQQANPNSFHYIFELSDKHCFISCSPERLYLRDKNQLITEALAGTVVRGRNPREDALLLQSLLNDKKIDRENHIVQEFIIANLKQLKAKVTCLPASALKLKNVQHLCVPIHAELNEKIEDTHLLYKLHPTPAVGGIPKLPALQFINDNEPYVRGWYAGAVGCISKNRSDFSVAIRSALIHQNSIKLFAGAGIVTGSIASQEWQELDNKIETILTILGKQKG